MHRLLLILAVSLGLLLAACSDDDDGAALGATGTGPTPTAVGSVEAAIEGTFRVDFTGAPEELDAIEVNFEVGPGTTAWEAIKSALGEDRLVFDDFGGDLGIFIAGFDGVEAEGNHFWEFKINGKGSEMGVSLYEVQHGDVLEFVYSSF